MWFSRSNDVRVVAGTYQFFTGSIPGAAGFEFLIESSTNATDLSDAYYAQFNVENRFINFANNLGVAGPGASKFQSEFGGLTFEQTIRKAYDMIVGLAEAQAAGINTETAIQFFISSQSFYSAVAQERVVPGGTPLDQATKIVALGSIINEAIKAGVGKYATAVNAFVADVTPDGASALLGGSLSTGGTFTLTPGHDRADATVAFLNGPENLVPFRFTPASEIVRAPSGTLSGPDTLQDPSKADDDLLTIDLNGAFPANLSLIENIEHIEISMNGYSGPTIDFEGVRGAETLFVKGTVASRVEFLNIDKTTFSKIDASGLSSSGGRLFIDFEKSLVQMDRTIIGSTGHDALGGSSGNDTLAGGIGEDILFGNAGDDVIRGGADYDLIVTGSGSDRVIFEATAAANGHDKLRELDGDTIGTGDRFDFTAFLGGPAKVLIAPANAAGASGYNASGSNVVIFAENQDLNDGADLVARIGAGSTEINLGVNRNVVVLLQDAGGLGVSAFYVTTNASGDTSDVSEVADFLYNFASEFMPSNFV